MRDDIKTADSELHAYYTSAVDLSAQSYESGGGESKDVEASLVDCHHRRELAFYERVHGTFQQLSRCTARVLDDIYVPYGLPDLRSRALQPFGLGGTYVRIALVSQTAVAAFLKRFQGAEDAAPEHVGGWLRDEASRQNETLFTAICNECRTTHVEALRAYAGLMVARHRQRRSDENAILQGLRAA